MNTQILEFVDLIYSAASRPQDWRDFCRALSRRFDDAYIAMHGHDELTGDTLGFLNTTYSDEYLKQYKAHFGAVNPWMLRAAKAPVGQVQASEAILPHEELVKTECYNDWIKPQEDIATGAGVTLSRTKTRFFRLSCNIRFRDRDKHQDDLVQLLKILTPHMRRSLEMAQAFASIPFKDDIEGALNLTTSPVFVLDRDCTVLFYNMSAASFIKTSAAVSLSRESKLIFKDADASLKLRRIAKELLTSDFMGAITAPNMRFQSADGELAARVSLFNARGAQTLGFLDVAFQEAPVIMLKVLNDDNKVGLLKARLHSDFRLSPAEIELSLALRDGRSLQEYADHRDISLNTVKTQLKNAFVKLNVNRQIELVSLLADIL